MKKNILFLLCTCCWNLAYSQTIIKADLEPQIGETYHRHYIDNWAVLGPGNAGTGQTWDLSTASYDPQNDYHFEVKDPAGTPYSVPGASFVIENYPLSNATYLGYSYCKDTVTGYYDLYKFEGILETNYFGSEFLYKFPLNFGDSLQSDFSYSSTAVGVTYQYNSRSSLSFTGTGTLITDSATFSSVFRFTYRKMDVRQAPNDTSYTIKYLWYKPGIHHLLAEYTSYTDAGGATYDHAYLYSVPDVTGVSNVKLTTDLRVYPVPTTGGVVIHSDHFVESILLTDLCGKVIERFENIHGKQFSLETEHVSNGIYFLQISNGEFSESRKIVVSH